MGSSRYSLGTSWLACLVPELRIKDFPLMGGQGQRLPHLQTEKLSLSVMATQRIPESSGPNATVRVSYSINQLRNLSLYILFKEKIKDLFLS